MSAVPPVTIQKNYTLWAGIRILIFLFIPTTVYAIEPYLQLDSYSYSEPTPIDSIIHKFNGKFTGGTQAFTHEWIEAGIRQNKWELGVFSRYDYDLSFSRDLAEFYYQTSNRLALNIGKVYQGKLKARHYRTHGIRVGYHFQPSTSLDLTLGIAYLIGTELIDGSIDGSSQATARNNYNFAFHSDIYYSKDPLFGRGVSTPYGRGYSVDLKARWKPVQSLNISLLVKDLLGKLYWKQAPHTAADAGSNNKTFDASGYVKFVPVLHGIEDNRNFTQTLKPFGTLRGEYQLTPQISIIYNGDFTAETFFSGLGAGYNIFHQQQVALLFSPQTGAVEFDYKGPYWKIRLASNAFRYRNANLLRVTVYLGYPF